MSDAVMKVLAGIGIISVICILATIVIVAISDIDLKIEEYQRRYRIKHRFDKPPTAKCYCRDCKFWDKENGKCHSHHTAPGYHMADCWFCYSAEPITGEVFKQREEWIRKNKDSEKK